jgi:hypothetical protein
MGRWTILGLSCASHRSHPFSAPGLAGVNSLTDSPIRPTGRLCHYLRVEHAGDGVPGGLP